MATPACDISCKHWTRQGSPGDASETGRRGARTAWGTPRPTTLPPRREPLDTGRQADDTLSMATRGRRDAGRARGEPIVDSILEHTLADLSRAGLDGLSIDRIARAAAVNKTTIYRR